MKRNNTLKWLGFFALVLLLVLPVLMLSGCCKKGETPPAVQPDEPKTYSITYAGVDGAENPNTVASFTSDSGSIALADPVKSSTFAP